MFLLAECFETVSNILENAYQQVLVVQKWDLFTQMLTC